MSRISHPADRSDHSDAFAAPITPWILVAAFLTAQICLYISHPLKIFSERVNLIRHGVMVDGSVCELAVDGIDWNESETRYFKLYTERGTDLNTVEMRLSNRLFLFNLGAMIDAETERKIGRRLDAIFEKAKEILDMNPRMSKPDIRVFKDRERLYLAHRELTGNTAAVKAFYSFDCATIYTCEDDMTDSVIAHEMAHAIVDNTYNGIPSSNIAEMLASYVDMHISG